VGAVAIQDLTYPLREQGEKLTKLYCDNEGDVRHNSLKVLYVDDSVDDNIYNYSYKYVKFTSIL